MEPVLGAGGVMPPHPSFMPMVREICDRNGILLISDEVITAFGRTGSESGARHWGVQPDLMCTAKAITNGYFPFGAVMISGKVAHVFEKDTSRHRLHRHRLHLFRPPGRRRGGACRSCRNPPPQGA